LFALSSASNAGRIGDEGLFRVEVLGKEIKIGLKTNGAHTYKTRYDVRIWGSVCAATSFRWLVRFALQGVFLDQPIEGSPADAEGFGGVDLVAFFLFQNGSDVTSFHLALDA
jgi:hypothetical protein